MNVTEEERAYLDALSDQQETMEALLKRLVAQNSFTAHREGVNAVGDLLGEALEDLGFRTSELVGADVGRTVVARRGAEGSHRLLLLGHTDTVHPPDSEFVEYRVDGARATGPGAADMKGGLVIIVTALRALAAAGRLTDRQVVVVLGADEEIGSPTSADLIRAEASDAHLCLCYEAGRPRAEGGSTFVTGRKGFGRFVLKAHGRAAHAGVDPGRGGSAVLELAHKVVRLSDLADPDAGISVNVGTFHGGTTANTVPENAEIAVDYRFPDDDTQIELEDEMLMAAGRNIVKDADGRALVATRIQDHVKRPAMERSEAMERMAGRVVAWGRDLGLDLAEESRGGSSDAALATEVGCPALCGMGVVGDAFHTDQEWILRESLVERARLTALTIDRFFAL